MSAGRVINIYRHHSTRSLPLMCLRCHISFRPNRWGNTNFIKRPMSLMKMAQTTCQDEGNILAILNRARDMQRQARRETMLVRT